MHIQWYPGHMAKAKRLLAEQLKAVDVILEIRDARIPFSSANQDLIALAQYKPRIIILNKVDLCDLDRLIPWEKKFKETAFAVIRTDSLQRKGIKEVMQAVHLAGKEIMAKRVAKGLLPRPVRAMVIGIPNVGKSSFINAMVKRGSTRTGNKPGVTKGNQWVRLLSNIELMDTPGILWPRFEDPQIGEYLAFTGAISERIFNIEEAADRLIDFLRTHYPLTLNRVYGVQHLDRENHYILEEIGSSCRFLDKKGEIEMERTSLKLLHDFQTSKMGCFTLDDPPTLEEHA